MMIHNVSHIFKLFVTLYVFMDMIVYLHIFKALQNIPKLFIKALNRKWNTCFAYLNVDIHLDILLYN